MQIVHLNLMTHEGKQIDQLSNAKLIKSHSFSSMSGGYNCFCKSSSSHPVHLIVKFSINERIFSKSMSGNENNQAVEEYKTSRVDGEKWLI